jgi:predicted nucleotidyltransferase
MSNAPASVSDELPVSGKLRETLHRATEAVQDIYGSRLRHLFLFGSHARGEATPESDVDLLVVLEGPVQFYDEAKRISRIATRAAAYRGTALSFVYMNA